MSIFFLDPDLTPNDVLQGLKEAFPLKILEQSTEHLTYFDTFDWRLSKAGLTLAASPAGSRYRLTLLTGDGRILKTRASQIPRFAADLPVGPFRDALQSTAKIRRMLPKAQAIWNGELFSVLNEDEKTVVRLFVLEGEASLPTNGVRELVPPRIRLLPLKGYEEDLNRVSSYLKKSFPLRSEERGELSVVLRALGQRPKDRSAIGETVLDPNMAAADAARAIHMDLLGTMLVNQEGIASDWDPEFLHDFRVALRRIRSILTQIKGVYPESVVSHYADEFRWLGAVTGPTRDLDVYLLKIPAYRDALTENARGELEPLVLFLEEKKKAEHGLLLEALASERFTELMGGWQTFLVNPQLEDPELLNARRPIKAVASERIWRAYRKVLRKRRGAWKGTSPQALHRLRIDCKKLRYLLTFFRDLYPAEQLNPLLKELKKLQDHLGDFNDLQVQREALKSSAEEMIATETGAPSTLLAMGQLMGQLETRQSLEHEAFQKRFRRFSRQANQDRFQNLFGPPPDTEPESATGKGPS